jgi:hypothetical protein
MTKCLDQVLALLLQRIHVQVDGLQGRKGLQESERLHFILAQIQFIQLLKYRASHIYRLYLVP